MRFAGTGLYHLQPYANLFESGVTRMSFHKLVPVCNKLEPRFPTISTVATFVCYLCVMG